jgi:hypothetical protein
VRGQSGENLHLRTFGTVLLHGSSSDFPRGPVEKINDVAFVDSNNSVIYQLGATGTLPEAMKVGGIIVIDAKKTVVYVGTNHDGNIPSHIMHFSDSRKASGMSVTLNAGLINSEWARLIALVASLCRRLS